MDVRFKDYLQDGKEILISSNDIRMITGDEDSYALIEDIICFIGGFRHET